MYVIQSKGTKQIRYDKHLKDFVYFLVCLGSFILGMGFYAFFGYPLTLTMIPLLLVLGALIDEKKPFYPVAIYSITLISLAIVSLIIGAPFSTFIHSLKFYF